MPERGRGERMTEHPLLGLHGLTKRYGTTAAVQDISAARRR